MEARIAKLLSDVEYIKRDVGELRSDVKDLRSDVKEMRKEHHVDFRITFGALIAATLGLAGLMAKGFHWL